MKTTDVVRQMRRVATICGALACALGAITLLGWLSGLTRLVGFSPGLLPMPPAAGIGFLVVGAATVLFVAKDTRPARMAVGVIAVAALIPYASLLVEFAFGRSGKIEEALFHTPGTLNGVPIGHMSPIGMSSFLALCVALLLLAIDGGHVARDMAGIIAASVVAVATILMLGYLYGSPLLYGGPILPVPLPAAVGFFLLSVGITSAAGPEQALLRPMVGGSVSARLLRIFVPLVAIAVIAPRLAEASIEASFSVNLALLSGVSAIIVALVVGFVTLRISQGLGSAIDRAEAEREAANDALHEELARVELLRDVSVSVTADLDLQAIAHGALSSLRDHLGMHAGAIRVLDQTRGRLALLDSFGLPRSLLKRHGDVSMDRDEYLAVRAVKTEKTLTHDNDDQGKDPTMRLMAERAAPEGLRYVVAPICHRNVVLGTLSLSFEKERPFSREELALIDSVTRLLGQAMENASLYDVERRISDTLQSALLAMPEKITGIEFAHVYHSAAESARVGGDFFDIFELSNARIGVVIGDVSGKGLQAATTTALAKNTIRAYAFEGHNPADVMRRLNRMVNEAGSDSSFVTAFFATLDRSTGALTYCSAGHPPVTIKRKGGDVDVLVTRSPLLGPMPHASFSESEDLLHPGDTMLLYTDGVIEAGCGTDMYGEKRLLDLLSDLKSPTAETITRAVLADVLECTDGELSDDLALLAVSPKRSRMRKPVEKS